MYISRFNFKIFISLLISCILLLHHHLAFAQILPSVTVSTKSVTAQSAQTHHHPNAPSLKGVSQFDFGQVPIGSFADQAFQFDANSYRVEFTDVSISGDDFSVISQGCRAGQVLNPGQSCRDTIRFRPSGIGSRSGYKHYDFNFSNPNNPDDAGFDFLDFDLTGTGVNTSSLSIRITSPNDQTQIDIGDSLSFTSEYTFEGPNSFLPSYSWSFEGGSPATSNAANPSNIRFNTAGNHSVTVTLTDGNVGEPTATDSITINVNDPNTGAAPTISITSPSNTSINIGDSLSFASSASSANPNFSPTYSWTFNGGTPSSSNQQNPGNVTFNTAGSHVVSVTVTDQSNGKTATDSMTINVNDSNTDSVPSIIITSPANQTQINVGDSLSFTASASSSNPEFSPSYNWTFNGATPGSSNQLSPSNIQFNTEGNQTVSATVTDQSNNRTANDSITIIVNKQGIDLSVDDDESTQQSINLGQVTQNSAPIERSLDIELASSGADERVEDVSILGRGFRLIDDNGNDVSECNNRSVGSGADQILTCDISFNPSDLPAGLHTALLTIDTNQQERIVELIANIDGSVELFSGGRLLNISTGTLVDPDGLAAGFIVSGSEPRRIVIMGENQSQLTDPVLKLTDITGTTILEENDNWQDSPDKDEIAALRELDSAQDAALAITLPQGVYLAWLSEKNGNPGQGIIGITDTTAPPGADETRLLNLSTNSQVSPSNPMAAGFIVSGEGTVKLAILAEQQSNSGLNPKLKVTTLNPNEIIASNGDWQDHNTADQFSNLDRTPANSTDAAFIITLEIGIYVAWMESEDGSSGQGLISITEVINP